MKNTEKPTKTNNDPSVSDTSSDGVQEKKKGDRTEKGSVPSGKKKGRRRKRGEASSKPTVSNPSGASSQGTSAKSSTTFRTGRRRKKNTEGSNRRGLSSSSSKALSSSTDDSNSVSSRGSAPRSRTRKVERGTTTPVPSVNMRRVGYSPDHSPSNGRTKGLNKLPNTRSHSAHLHTPETKRGESLQKTRSMVRDFFDNTRLEKAFNGILKDCGLANFSLKAPVLEKVLGFKGHWIGLPSSRKSRPKGSWSLLDQLHYKHFYEWYQDKQGGYMSGKGGDVADYDRTFFQKFVDFYEQDMALLEKHVELVNDMISSKIIVPHFERVEEQVNGRFERLDTGLGGVDSLYKRAKDDVVVKYLTDYKEELLDFEAQEQSRFQQSIDRFTEDVQNHDVCALIKKKPKERYLEAKGRVLGRLSREIESRKNYNEFLNARIKEVAAEIVRSGRDQKTGNRIEENSPEFFRILEERLPDYILDAYGDYYYPYKKLQEFFQRNDINISRNVSQFLEGNLDVGFALSNKQALLLDGMLQKLTSEIESRRDKGILAGGKITMQQVVSNMDGALIEKILWPTGTGKTLTTNALVGAKGDSSFAVNRFQVLSDGRMGAEQHSLDDFLKILFGVTKIEAFQINNRNIDSKLTQLKNLADRGVSSRSRAKEDSMMVVTLDEFPLYRDRLREIRSVIDKLPHSVKINFNCSATESYEVLAFKKARYQTKFTQARTNGNKKGQKYYQEKINFVERAIEERQEKVLNIASELSFLSNPAQKASRNEGIQKLLSQRDGDFNIAVISPNGAFVLDGGDAKARRPVRGAVSEQGLKAFYKTSNAVYFNDGRSNKLEGRFNVDGVWQDGKQEKAKGNRSIEIFSGMEGNETGKAGNWAGGDYRVLRPTDEVLPYDVIYIEDVPNFLKDPKLGDNQRLHLFFDFLVQAIGRDRTNPKDLRNRVFFGTPFLEFVSAHKNIENIFPKKENKDPRAEIQPYRKNRNYAGMVRILKDKMHNLLGKNLEVKNDRRHSSRNNLNISDQDLNDIVISYFALTDPTENFQLPVRDRGNSNIIAKFEQYIDALNLSPADREAIITPNFNHGLPRPLLELGARKAAYETVLKKLVIAATGVQASPQAQEEVFNQMFSLHYEFNPQMGFNIKATLNPEFAQKMGQVFRGKANQVDLLISTMNQYGEGGKEFDKAEFEGLLNDAIKDVLVFASIEHNEKIVFRLKNLREALTGVTREKDEAIGQREQLKTELAASTKQVTDMQTEIDRLTLGLASGRKDNEGLRNQLAQLTKEKKQLERDQQQLQLQLDALQQENLDKQAAIDQLAARLQRETEEKDAQRARADALQVRLNQVTAEREQGLAQIQDLTGQLDAATAAKNEGDDRIKGLVQQVSQLRNSLSQSDRTISGLQQDKKELERENAAFKKKDKEQQQKLKEARKEIDRLTKSEASLIKKLEKLGNKSAAQKRKLQEKLADIRSQKESLAYQVESLEREAEDMEYERQMGSLIRQGRRDIEMLGRLPYTQNKEPRENGSPVEYQKFDIDIPAPSLPISPKVPLMPVKVAARDGPKIADVSKPKRIKETVILKQSPTKGLGSGIKTERVVQGAIGVTLLSGAAIAATAAAGVFSATLAALLGTVGGGSLLVAAISKASISENQGKAENKQEKQSTVSHLESKVVWTSKHKSKKTALSKAESIIEQRKKEENNSQFKA